MTTPTVTWTGSYTRGDGKPSTGVVYFAAVGLRAVTADDVMLSGMQIKATVTHGTLTDTDGNQRQQLVANADGYNVKETVDGITKRYWIPGDVDGDLGDWGDNEWVTGGSYVPRPPIAITADTTLRRPAHNGRALEVTAAAILTVTNDTVGGWKPGDQIEIIRNTDAAVAIAMASSPSPVPVINPDEPNLDVNGAGALLYHLLEPNLWSWQGRTS